MLGSLLALALLLAPQLAPPTVQFASVGPADPIPVAAGGATIVQLDAGEVAGVVVLASDGHITPQGECALVLASAAVDAVGPVAAQIERGTRAANVWSGVAGGKTRIVPMTPIRLERGDSLRLAVHNPDARPIRVLPGTRFNVAAVDCADPIDEQAGADFDPRRGLFSWLHAICDDGDRAACQDELVRQWRALDSILGPPTRAQRREHPAPPLARSGGPLDTAGRALWSVAPLLLMLPGGPRGPDALCAAGV